MNENKTRKTLKRFVNVKFIGTGQNDIVPRSWLSDDRSLCRWPEKNFQGNIAMIAEKEILPKQTWKFYKCKVNCHSG